jgi:hypothetical protein
MNLKEIAESLGGLEGISKACGLTTVRMRCLLRNEEERRLLLKYLPELHKSTKISIDELYKAIMYDERINS